jgi:hypothetical protein
MTRTRIENTTYGDGDLVWKNHASAEFVGCVFRGTARDCNFAGATFTGCTFDPSFAIERCTIGGATGLPERFNAPASSIPPTRSAPAGAPERVR